MDRSGEGRHVGELSRRSSPKFNPFRYFNSSPEVIWLIVMMYVRFPLSLCNVEDLLFERGIDICHATVRLWWNRFGPLYAADIRDQRVDRMRGFRHWRGHLDEVFVKMVLSKQLGRPFLDLVMAIFSAQTCWLCSA